MKITIKRTEDQLALVRAMGSNNREEAYEAQAAVADLLGPVVSEVINNAPTVGNLYTSLSYGEDDNPSLPLDLFHDITDEDYIQVYSQQVAGGLPYSQVFPAHNELSSALTHLIALLRLTVSMFVKLVLMLSARLLLGWLKKFYLSRLKLLLMFLQLHWLKDRELPQLLVANSLAPQLKTVSYLTTSTA